MGIQRLAITQSVGEKYGVMEALIHCSSGHVHDSFQFDTEGLQKLCSMLPKGPLRMMIKEILFAESYGIDHPGIVITQVERGPAEVVIEDMQELLSKRIDRIVEKFRSE